MCFLITGFVAEVRFGNYGFGRDVKFLTVCKAVLAINETISMASNTGTGPLKLGETKLIRPLEIVIDGFGKYNLLLKKKLPVEVDIPYCLCMKFFEKDSIEHER